MTYQAYRFRLIRFVDNSTISRIAEPVIAISEESAIADIEEAYGQEIFSWVLYNG
jgi:hypothetical protein